MEKSWKTGLCSVCAEPGEFSWAHPKLEVTCFGIDIDLGQAVAISVVWRSFAPVLCLDGIWAHFRARNVCAEAKNRSQLWPTLSQCFLFLSLEHSCNALEEVLLDGNIKFQGTIVQILSALVFVAVAH